MSNQRYNPFNPPSDPIAPYLYGELSRLARILNDPSMDSLELTSQLAFPNFRITEGSDGLILDRVGGVAGSSNFDVLVHSDNGARVRLRNTQGSVILQMNSSAGTPSSGMRLQQASADLNTDEGNWITGERNGKVSLYWDAAEKLRTVDEESDDEYTGAEVLHADDTFYPVAIGVWPSPDIATNITLDKTHLNKQLQASGAARAFTTPASTDTDFPIGGVLMLATGTASAGSTIVAGSGITLSWLSGSAVTNGSPRTLGTGAVVWLMRRSAAVFRVWGFGIS